MGIRNRILSGNTKGGRPFLSKSILLAQDGVFPLDEILPPFELARSLVCKHIWTLQQNDENVREVMGLFQQGRQWMVDMPVFADYYLTHSANRIRKVEDDWDVNQLLLEKGIFFLADVCRLLPFRVAQIRYQASKWENPKKEIGVWKDPETKCYLVDMARFGPYLRHTWATVTGRTPKDQRKKRE